MRSLLEKAIIHLLNGDNATAESMFHKFMVERAREIHESLRQNEDIQLSEGWDSEITEEEYFDDLGDEDQGEADTAIGDDEAALGDDEATLGDDEAALGDDEAALGDEEEALGDEEDALGDDQPDLGDEVAGHEDIEGKLDDIEAKMDELSQEFDRLMGELDSEGDLGDEGEEDLGGEEDFGDLGGDEGDIEDEGQEFGHEGEDTTDLADRMEDDLSDEDQPEHELPEGMSSDDEVLEDITESVLAELEKVSIPSNSEGKGVAAGGYNASPHTEDALPHHPTNDRVNQAKPVMTKGPTNDSFEREAAPSNKEVKRRRNNDAGVKKLTKVPDKGDNSALLNKDFTPQVKTKLPIDGSNKIKT